ncbi:hypothetical protein Vi05172_g9255 [Venturia inaequalis]|nr:hypothetical protein Vi05172_g9255 [Venturia inaequalis]
MLNLMCSILTLTNLCSHSIGISGVENGNSGLSQMMDWLRGGSEYAGHRVEHVQPVLSRRDIPHGLYGQSHRNVVIPRWDDFDYNRLNWSSDTSVRRSGRAQHILYNYTVYTDDDGIQRSRWLKREIVPIPRQIARRGYRLVDPFIWKPCSGGDAARRVIIKMCYLDDTAFNALRALVDEGINRWYKALGPKRGVGFKFTKGRCFQWYDAQTYAYVPSDDFDWNTVIVRYSPSRREATLGNPEVELAAPNGPGKWNPDAYEGAMLSFYPDQSESAKVNRQTPAGSMTHELGHVLGLLHEHQRFDASNSIDYNCKAVNHYDEVERYLKDYPLKHPYRANGNVNMDDVCQDYVIARMFEDRDALKHQPDVPTPRFSGWTLMPIVFRAGQSSRAPDGTNMANDLTATEVGLIDLKSIMMYRSHSGAKPPLYEPTLTIRGEKGSNALLPVNENPSEGDKAAVDAMYPPLA